MKILIICSISLTLFFSLTIVYLPAGTCSRGPEIWSGLSEPGSNRPQPSLSLSNGHEREMNMKYKRKRQSQTEVYWEALIKSGKGGRGYSKLTNCTIDFYARKMPGSLFREHVSLEKQKKNNRRGASKTSVKNEFFHWKGPHVQVLNSQSCKMTCTIHFNSILFA